MLQEEKKDTLAHRSLGEKEEELINLRGGWENKRPQKEGRLTTYGQSEYGEIRREDQDSWLARGLGTEIWQLHFTRMREGAIDPGITTEKKHSCENAVEEHDVQQKESLFLVLAVVSRRSTTLETPKGYAPQEPGKWWGDSGIQWKTTGPDTTNVHSDACPTSMLGRHIHIPQLWHWATTIQETTPFTMTVALPRAAIFTSATATPLHPSL